MYCGIEACREADLLISYVFPEDFSFSGYSGEFVVYATKGGTPLLTVNQTPSLAGSALSFAANVMSLLIKADDIDALPADADPTLPSVLWHDLILTNPGNLVTKIQGGAFKVLPTGAALCGSDQTVYVYLNGQEISIQIVGGPSFNIDVDASAFGASLVQSEDAAEARDILGLPALFDQKADVDFSNVDPATGRAALGLPALFNAKANTDLGNVTAANFAGKDFSTGTEVDPQSLGDRFGDWINPRAYGVKADGVTDDTAAVQATWNAIMATGKPCLWPAGRMVITSKITVNLDSVSATGVLVKGAGLAKTVFDCRGITTYPNFEFVSTNACSYPEITDMGWWGNQPGYVLGISGSNLALSQMNFLKLKGFVQNFNTTNSSRAMIVNGLYGGEIDMICNCGTGGYVGGNGVALTVRQALFVKFRGSYGSANTAVYLTGGTISGCTFDTLDMENVAADVVCDASGAFSNDFWCGRWAYSSLGYNFTAGAFNRIINPNIGASGGANDAMFVAGGQVGVELITNYPLPVTTPAFPATATNVVNNTGRRIIVYVRGGTIANISVGGVVTGAISGPFLLKPNDPISFNYTVAGTWTWTPE